MRQIMTSFVNKERLAGRAKKPGRKVLLSITCVLIAVALTSPVVFSQAKVGTTGAQFWSSVFPPELWLWVKPIRLS